MSSDSSTTRSRTDAVAVALRDAINTRGVTLAWLHERLRARGNSVSMATLSYWRSGARRPEGAQSMAALGDIEELLHLTEGTLTHLIGSTNRTGPLGPLQFPIDEAALEQMVKDVFAALGADYPDTSREITTHSVTDVDVDGNVALCVTRSVVQSTVGTVTSIPFLELSPGVPTPPPLLEAVSGGHVSARYSHPSGEVHGALFELEAPLTAPEATAIEWSIGLPPGYPATKETGHAVGRQCRELLVWIRFHPDALPDWITEKVETPTGIETISRSLDGRTSVHSQHRSFGPGAVTFEWGYGDQPS